MQEVRLLYLSAGAVSRCLPDVDQQIELVRQAFQALRSADAEMPPKVGVHPRPNALVEAMPAWWRSRDVVGIKWISAYPGNRRRGRDHVQGLVILNDADTGTPECVLDARQITAARTAAVSAFAIKSLLSTESGHKTALFGAGVQGRAHAIALAALGLVTDLKIFDRNPARASAFVAWAESDLGLAGARAAASAREALAGAELLVTCASPGPQRQLLDHQAVADAELVVAIDDDVYVSAEVVESSGLFLVDDVQQFRAFRSNGSFTGFRDPEGSLADDFSGLVPTDQKPIVVVTLGIGMADVLFASAVFENARSIGAGIELER